MYTKDVVSPRVRDVIVKTEQESEIFISFLQLGFVAFLGILYFLAPKGHMGNVPIRPVPLVLLVYMPIVLTRLVLALRRALNPFLLNLSVVVDMAMICVLIWTFFIQYQQPAGFYLKAPSAMYLFIFIALRSLRYDWRYVLMAGVTASIGWAILTVYAIYSGSGITGDFVEYVTGTTVLIGAQVDRIIALLALSAILAVSVQRSGVVLQRAAAEGTAREDLSRYFSPNVVERILEADGGLKPGDGETNIAAVIMIDLRGFSKWAASIEPSEVMTVLAEYQAEIVPIVLKNNGSIDKFMGDGVLAHFGALSQTETYAFDALSAAEQIHDALEAWSDRRRARGLHAFEFGMGIAGGRLIFGAVGERDRLEFTVIGAPVNLAAKLEKHTKRVRTHVLSTAHTYQVAVNQGFEPRLDFRILTGESVDGIAEAVDLVGEARHAG